MAEMTSRQRVLAALRHEEPDRVPVDVGGGGSTSLVEEAYHRLRAHVGLPPDEQPAIMSKLFRVVRLRDDLHRLLGGDCYPITARPAANWTPPPSEPGTFVDVWGVTWRQAYYAEGCYYWELYKSPLAEATIADLDAYPWPDALDPGYTRGLADEARQVYEGTDYALVADGGFKSFWEAAFPLRGFEQSLVDLAANPEFTRALLEKILEVNLRGTARFLDAVGRYVQVFRTADDLATQSGLLMSPATYRSVLKPAYRRFLEMVRSKTDARIFYHSCGNVEGLLGDLIDVGVEVVNPVQVSALTDVSAIKARFGASLSFWGGIDTQHVLPRGTPADVEAEVVRRIRELGPGGGFVLAAVHNIQPDVPPRNILAMVEAARRHGRYPLCLGG